MSNEKASANCLKLNVTECLNKKGLLTHNRCYQISTAERSSDYESTIEKGISRDDLFRYKKASRKEKTVILNEFHKWGKIFTGCCPKVEMTILDGKVVWDKIS
jgi:hypothetical protein